MKKLVLLIASSLGVLGFSVAADATTIKVGGDRGHPGDFVDTCAVKAVNLTPGVACSSTTAAQGMYNWQVPLPVAPPLGSINISASATALVPDGPGNPTNQRIFGRLLLWS